MLKPNPPLSRNSLQLQRFILAVAIALLGGLIGVFTLVDFQQLRQNEQDKLASQASLIAANLQLHMRSANDVLDETMALMNFTETPQLRDRMQSLVNAMPMIRGIGLLDSNGVQTVGTVSAASDMNFSDRPYFRNVKEAPQRQRLYISTPYRGVSGNIHITLSKAILDEYNRFQGVAFAVLNAEYMELLMASTLYTPDMWAALVHVETGDALRVGARLPKGRQASFEKELRALLPQIGDAGRSTFIQALNQHDQIVAANLITSYAGNTDRTLLVVTGRNYHDALKGWLRLAYMQAGLFALAAAAAVSGLLFYQRRRRQDDIRRARDQRLLRAQEDDYRAIVEHTTDCVVKLDPSGNYSYANPAFHALFELEPTTSGRFLDRVMAEDFEHARDSLKASLHGQTKQRLNLRFATPKGRRDMEWTLCSIPGEDAAAPIVVGIGRDITAHIAMRDELRARAHHDSLTNLVNRGYFMEIAAAEIKHTQSYQQTLSILMIDLDHFKNINDTWGHNAGDTALQACAATLRQHCREFDVAARIGGEEFTMLLPGATTQDAMTAAERLRAALADQVIVLSDGDKLRLTASFGVASLEPDDTLETLLQRADAALYAAKQSGRNRVRAANADEASPA